MKIKKLIKDIPNIQVRGSKEIEVSGICSNSKLAAPGSLFIAKKGLIDDGVRYIEEAIRSGAVAVATDIYDPSLKVTQLIHPKIASIEGALAATYYQFPSEQLYVVGLTGTNGKTTTSFLIKHFLDTWEGSCGLIGTIEYIIGKSRYLATRTTPDVVSNHKMLREMVLHGCSSAIMEVTSHALDQGRVNCIAFDLALFTNLTVDHLDYHGSIDNYLLAKNRLFRDLLQNSKKKDKIAVVNNDSPYASKILEGCQAPVFSFGAIQKADLQASEIILNSAFTTFKLNYQGKTQNCKIPLVGRYNVYNCLGALSVGLAKGISLEKLVHSMEHLPSVPGRLESVKNHLGIKIYVDFAHTGDALANVLETLEEVKTGRIITVFGCGGDRDQNRRSQMAEAAETHSDLCIVTSDNPRSENPLSICNEIISHFKNRQKTYLECDREKAIALAIDLAKEEDIVLIAGKGHETYQIFAHKTIEFDDRKIATKICLEKEKNCYATLS